MKPGKNFSIYLYFKNAVFCLTLTLLVFALPFIASKKVYCHNGGFKYISNYSDEDHLQKHQNWWILQDKRGIIYVANQGGLLEFDGVCWRTYKIPNQSVRSMVFDDKGALYVGGNNEIGFFTPDAKGSLKYTSLVNRIKENEQNFSEVWRTLLTGDGVYFQTSKFLFHWDGGQMKVYKPAGGIKAAFYCGGKLFIRREKVGLMRAGGSSFKRVAGGKTFADKKIFMMAQWDAEKLLIGTYAMGLYIYDGLTAKPFHSEAGDYLREKKLCQGIRLSSGDFALTTRRGGLVIIDSRGRVKEIFTKASGLRDDNVKYVYEDLQGNLWLALNNGIAKIEYKTPISVHDARSGLPALILSAARHSDDLYAGTTHGLYYLGKENNKPTALTAPGKFRSVPGISGDCRSLLTMADSLLAATSDGVFLVKNGSRLLTNNAYTLLRSSKDRNRLWVGTREGLFTLYLDEGRPAQTHQLERINQPIHSIVEDNSGNLWLGTLTKGVFKVDFPGSDIITNPEVNQYDSAHGLPSGETHVFWAADHVLFATQKGIFRFDGEKKIFIPDTTLGEEFAGGPEGKAVFRVVEDIEKNIYFHSFHRNFAAVPQPDNTYVIYRKPFCQIPFEQANTIYPDPDGNHIWFACNEVLVRYDKRKKKNYNLNFSTLIRKVVVNRNLVFDGAYRIDGEPQHLIPAIDYKNRKNFHFEFAAPFFESESRIEYRCRLDKHDDDWTNWNRDSYKDFTTLDSGTYRFRVQARNVYDNVSSEGVFQFKILLPWYKTWWAFSLYALVFFLVMFLMVKWRSGKLERENLKLERIVKERTREIEEKNQQLEKQTFQLKEQSEKLKEMDRVKSRFFANISHEFRTPLTLIMGPLEQMLSDGREKDEEKKLNLMLRNSQRLLSLINQLLDLSKFESGKMRLKAVCQNIIPFIKGIVDSFEAVTTRNELDLIFQAEEEDVTLPFDPEKLEEITFNLLSNAVKFTPPGGKITVSVARKEPGEDKFPSGSLAISVSDTGPGIPRDQLAHIFDRFFQSESTYEHHQKGSGIGLAIAKELVELHRGSIDVHSSAGKGTEFIIRLPLGKEHLQSEEIVEITAPPMPSKTPAEIPAFAVRAKEAAVREESGGEEKAEKRTAAGAAEVDPLKPGREIILVVEDSADVRDYIAGALEQLYQVVEARDGLEGLRTAQEIVPDLIISDVTMPGIDGYELCRELKNDIKTSHIPVIILTARASEESIIRGLQTGADDYITKPFNTRILCARIKNLIELRNHLQQTLNREMTLKPVEIPVSQIDKKFIKKLQKVIDENISDPEFNIDQLCRKMEMSQPSIYRKIQALSGESPTEFIRSFRLKRGAELLKNNFGSILEVALEVGFSSANYFTKCFKKKFHQLPSTFQAAESEAS